MSVRSKATGAALAVAAPEAELGAAAAGKAGKRSPDPRVSRPGSKAAQQRQQIEDLKARRKPDEPDDEHDDEDQDDDEQDGGRFAPFAGMQAPATGGGVVLGVIVWALVRAYIGNPGQPSGAAGVKALVNAKLFNKTTK